jgi:thioredoxin
MAVVVCANCGAKNRVEPEEASARQPVCGKCGAKLEASAAGGGTETVTDATFAGSVLGAGAGAPVLVDFWAEWCGPCRMIAPTLEQLAAESGGRYRVAKLNVDENPVTASQYGVRSIPTLIIFKGGREVERLVGAQPRQQIAARLAAHS